MGINLLMFVTAYSRGSYDVIKYKYRFVSSVSTHECTDKPDAVLRFPQLVMSGDSCLNQTCTGMSTALVILLWSAMGESP